MRRLLARLLHMLGDAADPDKCERARLDLAEALKREFEQRNAPFYSHLRHHRQEEPRA